MNRLGKWWYFVAALALVVFLAAPALAAEAKGKIKSIDSDKKELIMTDNDGKELTFVMDDDGKVQLNDKDAKLSDLKKGDEVTVTYEKKGDKLIASKIVCKRE